MEVKYGDKGQYTEEVSLEELQASVQILEDKVDSFNEKAVQNALERLKKEVPLKVFMNEEKSERKMKWNVETQSIAGRKLYTLWVITGSDTGVAVSGKLDSRTMFELITTIIATHGFIRRDYANYITTS